MVKPFTVKTDKKQNTDLKKKIRDRCIECWVPNCWELKDEHDDGQIYLSKQITPKQKRVRVQIRRLLFKSAYKQLPYGRYITMVCGNSRCINPAHMTARGFSHSYDVVKKMIQYDWLTEEQANEWYVKGERESESVSGEKASA